MSNNCLVQGNNLCMKKEDFIGNLTSGRNQSVKVVINETHSGDFASLNMLAKCRMTNRRKDLTFADQITNL